MQKLCKQELFGGECAPIPWIRGPRETKERKGKEGSERDKPLSDRTNQMINPESGLSCACLFEAQTVKRCEDSMQNLLTIPNESWQRWRNVLVVA